MTGSIYDWSLTAASNATADGDINWAEGQAPSTVNNSARQVMARVAEFIKDIGGTITATGTANAILVAANSNFTTYATGQIVAFRAAADNTATATLSVNSIGAKSIRKFTANGETALSGAEIQQGGVYVVMYDAALNAAAGGWNLINPAVVSLGPTVSMESTDAGATAGPTINMLRNSASPDPADLIGAINFQGKDSAGNTETYARIVGSIEDPSSGTEAGNILFGALLNGVMNNIAKLDGSNRAFCPATNGTGDIGAAGLLWGNGFFDGTVSAGAVDIGGFSAVGGSRGLTIDNLLLQSSLEFTSTGNHQRFYNPNGMVGGITTGGSATSFNTSSDGRRKKNLRDFDSGGFIDALDVWLFDWVYGGTGYGVIAQDAQLVFPDAITEGDDGFLQADYSKFVPLLLREVKALRARVAALEA